MHETLSENQSKDVSESECNIVHKTLSQNNSADVPANVITELKDDQYKEPLVIGKGTSYFNILECGRNLLDQLDVTYQGAFMASPVHEGHYIPSPARERYYDQLSKSLINYTVGSDGTINNDNLNQEITDLKAEAESGHQRNINDMTQVQVVLKFSSAVEIFWINLTLRINGHSWHHQYKRNTICHHQHSKILKQLVPVSYH